MTRKTFALTLISIICSMIFVTTVFALNSRGFDATISSSSIASLSSGNTKMNSGYHTSIWRESLVGDSMLVETKTEYKVLFTWKNKLGYNSINQSTVKATLKWELGGNYAVIHTWRRISGGSSLTAEFGYYNW